MWLGKAVPGTYILADITAKNPVFKFPFYRVRDFLLEFNGEIRDAPGAIHYAELDTRVRGAGVNAAGTGATIILYRRWVRSRLQVNDQFSQEKVTSQMPVEQEAVLPRPAYTGFFCPLPFHHGGGIHKGPS